MLWDLAHIANYEELWLIRSIDERPAFDAALDDLYDAFEHPRWTRPDLPILGPDEARRYAAGVRDAALALLAEVDLSADGPDLLANGFIFGMVIQHEHQHDETLLATRQLMGEASAPPPGASGHGHPPRTTPLVIDDVLIPGGDIEIGTSREPWAYDNERPAHRVAIDPFRLDRHPVTNREYAAFIETGGYREPHLWNPAGWTWCEEAELRAPQFWRRPSATDGGVLGWEVLRFGSWQPVHPDEPVQHVCFWEADAFARWADRRLPTELEWECAATIGDDGAKRRWPWGDEPPSPSHAQLGQRHDGPEPVGSHPDGANPWAVGDLIGGVWEWTSSGFEAWPGFRSFPYREYSEVFFGGDYRVLRGGAWGVDPVAVRATFRNWDLPIRRQIFSGFRTASDGDAGPRRDMAEPT